MATPAVIEKIKAIDLTFDRANPRLVGYGIQPATSEEEVIKTLWVEMAVDEVAMSIAASGLLAARTLIVVHEDGKWVVIEGNRRLAAVQSADEHESCCRSRDQPGREPFSGSASHIGRVTGNKKHARGLSGWTHRASDM